MARMFGTDGVRGVANKELTAELAYKLGRAGAWVLGKAANRRPMILVGCDTRLSCDMLESALCAGICSVGATAVCLGVIPTPAVAYLTRYYEADAGVMISASHNSFEYNGIKFFSNQGFKLQDETEDMIEALVNDESEIINPLGDELGRRMQFNTAIDDYVNFLISTLDKTCFLGMRIVVDCANGASGVVAPKLFERLGANVTIIGNQPDGRNINKRCGSTHPEKLIAKVKEIGGCVGFALDGDADRLLAVDENGEMVDGDAILSVLGLSMKKRGVLLKDTIVATIMSNMGLDILGQDNSIKIARTKVGDRYVLEEMLRCGYTLGGEQSGHIILLNYSTTGDGLLTALHLLSTMQKESSTLADLSAAYKALPQVLVNAKVSNELKYKFMEDNDIKAMCEELEKDFAGRGRVVIRPSGTEPLVRVMIEGENYDYIKGRAEVLSALIESRLGNS